MFPTEGDYQRSAWSHVCGYCVHWKNEGHRDASLGMQWVEG